MMCLHEKYCKYRYCIVRECKNTSIKTPGKLFIQVPCEIGIRNTWLKLANRDPSSLSTKGRFHFCEDHFDLKNDMENYVRYKVMGSVKRIRMKPDCVPSRFDCQADGKDMKKRAVETSEIKIEVVEHDIKEEILKDDFVNSKPKLNTDNANAFNLMSESCRPFDAVSNEASSIDTVWNENFIKTEFVECENAQVANYFYDEQS